MRRVVGGARVALLALGVAAAAWAGTNDYRVQSFPLNPYVAVLDGQWQGIKFASDGNCYFASSSHDNKHGAAFFRYQAATGTLTMLAEDITRVCGEDPTVTTPQGKIHSNIIEYNGWLYLSTFLGNDWPEGQAAYTGGHVIGYELATGRFRDFGVIRANYAVYAGVAIDPVRNKLIVHVVRWWGATADSHIYRIDLATGTKEYLGAFPSAGAAFYLFVDRRGDCWISQQYDNGTLMCVRSATGQVDRWADVLPEKTLGPARCWEWSQVLPDGDRCVFRLQFGTGLHIFDASRFPADPTGAFQMIQDIGPTGAGIVLSGDRIYYVQRADRQDGSQEYQDFHLLSAALDPNAVPAIRDHGLIADQAGRLVWRIQSLTADSRSQLYMVGDWWLLPGEQGTSTGTLRHVDGPGSDYTTEPRGEFFAVTALTNAERVPPAVALLAPANGQIVSNTLTVSATATDNVAVAGVQFQLDGSNLGAAVTSLPYAVVWDTLQTGNGPHSLTAVAWDAAGNRTTSPAAAVTVSNPVTVSTGLVGFWSFDAADVSGNTLFDRSGNGSDATGYNTTATTGKVGQARHFNGSNSYAPVAADTNLRLTGDRALSLWLRTTNASRYEGVISKYEAAGAESGYLLRTTAAGLLDLRVGGNNMVGGGSRDAIDTRKINDGVWHHVVVLIKLGSGVTFYVDGVRTSVTTLNIQAGPGGATFQLGLNPFLEFGEHFNGDLDEVRVYNRMLSDAEIATLYQPGGGGDSVPPTVALTAPANNQTVSNNVTVSATASDNVGVVGVQFKLDGANLGVEDLTAPYSSVWDSTAVGNGLHTLTALARDAAGNQATAATVTANVSNPVPPPTVTITAPANGQIVFGSISVTATAAATAGVAGVQFKLDGANLGAEDGTAPYAVSWDTTQSANGVHSLTAIARDTSGNAATATAVVVTLSNDLTPPAVALTAPGNNQTVSNSVAVSAAASDNVGVVGVQFKLDGANLGAEDLAAPYAIVWDTTSVGNGPHTLSAVARDAAGNQSNAVALAVTVGNPTSPTAGLVGFWSFDNSDVSGNVLLDRSGNGSDAIGYNTTSITGRVGQARHFPGASSFAPVSSDNNLRLTGDRTLALWLRTSNNNRYEGLLSRYDASGLEFGYLLRMTPAGVLEVRIGGNNLATGGSRNTADTQKINDGGWHHAVVLLKAGVGVTFYIDGVRTSSTALPILIGTGGATFQMGSNPWLDYGNYFTGDLDEVRVYNRILSDAEVGALYRPGSSGDNLPPSVALTAPGNNQTVSNSVTVSAAASDNVGVAGVQFKLDGGNLGAEATAAPYAVAWDTTKVTNGVHTLTALARDAVGNQSSATSVTVTVRNAVLPPTVAITAPATGQTVFGSISVTATAAAPAGVAGVQFQLDGASLGAEDVSSPYAITWDTTQTGNGPHTLSAVVRDAVGNRTNSIAVAITVSNTASPAAGLVGFWTFNAADVNGNVFLDRSGNGSDATGYNTVAITGVLGEARRFNGLNSFAPVAVDTKLQLTGDRTFSFWVRTTNNSRWEGLLSRYEAAGSEAGYLVRTAASGVIEVRLGGNNVADGTCRVIPDTQKINDGNWHHAVVMIKIGTGISFYIDGTRTSTTAVPVISGAAGQPFQMGANPWLHWGNYFTGDLDQIRIFNRILSDTDVSALYQEGASVTAKQSASLQPLIAPSNSSAATTTLIANRTLDTDGDGLTDEQEILAGTDPTNAGSRLQMLLVVANPALRGVTLTWTTVPGHAYQVQYSKTPSGPWHENLPHSQLTAGTSQLSLSYTDATAATVGCRYYKIRLLPGSGAPTDMAATEVVGVYTVTLRRGDNPLAVPLHRLAEYRGAVASVANSNTVTLGSAAGFAPGQFGPQDGRPQYILLVRQDATANPGLAGDWWPITGNSATQVSVANGPDNLANLLVGGTQIEIRHLVTLQDLFGSALASTDQVWLGDGAEVGSPITFQTDGPAGYYQNGVWIGDGSRITLNPDQAVTVSRPAGPRAVALRWVGQVQVTPLTHYLVPGDNFIGNPFPVAARLDESGLASSGWVADANLQANAAEEDLLQAIGPGRLGAAVYYHNGTVSSAGWYVGGVQGRRLVLLPGRAYRFSIKAGTGMLRWRQPVPFTP